MHVLRPKFPGGLLGVADFVYWSLIYTKEKEIDKMVNKNRLLVFIVMAIVVAIGIFLYIRSLEWTVSITSNPTGAGVYINDEYKGVTPLKVTLYPKDNYFAYHLKLKKEGYKDVERGISKMDLKDNSIAIELVKNEESALVWKFNLGFEVVDSSPVVSGGKVYIGSYDHHLYCLDVNNGDVVFKYKTGHVIRSTPAVSDEKVYISSFDSYLYCLNANNGNFIWKTKIAPYKSSDWNKDIGISDSSPKVSNGKVYIGSLDSYLYCLNANNGNILWKFKTGGEIHSTLAVSDEKVYISSFDSYLYCLNADNGSVIWKYKSDEKELGLQRNKAEGMGYSSPVVFKGKIYIGSRDQGLYCFNANNGNVIWKYNIGIDYSSPAVYNGKVYIGLSGPALYCFNTDNGSMLWKYDRERGIPPDSFFSPVASNGKIYIGSDDSCIYCFNADNGNFIWKYEVGGPIRSTPAVSDKKVYVSSEIYSGSSYTSYLYCLSADN